MVAQGRWVGTMADVGGRVREGKPPKLWSKLGTWSQDTGHRGGGFKKASPHAADPEIAFLIPSFAILSIYLAARARRAALRTR